MKPSRLLLMCGPAFSGKTVLSRAIAEALGCRRISLDEINEQRGLPPGGQGLPAEQWELSSAEALRQLRSALAAGEQVVLDDTCCFRFLRDRYRQVADELGNKTVVIHLEVPVDELYRRQAANRADPQRTDVRDEVLASHLASFEHPDADEPTITFHLGDEIKPWIKRHLVRKGDQPPARGRET